MTKHQIIEWLINWFSKKNNLSTYKDLNSINFLEEDLIDSLGLTHLIVEIETQLNIRFTYDDFQNPKFSTINGLADIIISK